MKYKIRPERYKVVDGLTVYQIEALKSTLSNTVEAGELGGWIQGYDNLSQEGECWVGGQAVVYGRAKVQGNAKVFGKCKVGGESLIQGNARVRETAEIFDSVIEGVVYGNAKLYDVVVSDGAAIGKGAVLTDGMPCGGYMCYQRVGSEKGNLTVYIAEDGLRVTRGCFQGTLDEFKKAVEKTHGGNEYGKSYNLLIETAKILLEGGL